MEEKTRYESTKLLVAECETDGSMKLLLAKDLELWYRDKIKVDTSQKLWDLMRSVTRSISQSSLQGDFDGSSEKFLRKITSISDRCSLKQSCDSSNQNVKGVLGCLIQ